MSADRTVQVERWDVFARGPDGGNPGYLVRGGAGSEAGPEVAQAVARRYGGEAALVTVDGAALELRFFAPAGEITMCVHASIAAVSALVASSELAGHQVTARTSSGDCLISWDDATPPLVSVQQRAPRLGPPLDLASEAAACLGLPPESIAARSTIRVVGTSRSKLLVPLADAGAVHASQPDRERLGALCRGLDTTGCYVFAPHPDGRAEHLVARQFPVDAGILEDAATGVAASALAAYLAQPAGSAESVLVIDQGDTMGRPSELVARAYAAGGEVLSTQVAGRARFVLRETVSLTPSQARESAATRLRGSLPW